MSHTETCGRRYLSFVASHDLTRQLDTAAVVAGVSRSELIRTAASHLAKRLLADEAATAEETLAELEPVALGQ